MSQIVRRFECGLVADPSDPSDVVEKINWAREHPFELAVMSKRALEAAHHYNRDVSLEQLVRLIEEQGGLA